MTTPNVPALSGPRLPYHPAVEDRFGIDKASWKALVEAIFPAAKTAESVILALSYCKARSLDVFKRPVHIVPIYDSQKRTMVDTVWPGIGELRTTAFRTGSYAGMDEVKFGEDRTKTWVYTPKRGEERTITVTFPEWVQVTVYRMVQGHRVPFPGPRVYWLEAYARMGRFSDAPNSMWEQRARGQAMKCAEAAALRAAFPEEIGDDFSAEEVRLIQDVRDAQAGADEAREPALEEPAVRSLPPKGLDDLAAKFAQSETIDFESVQEEKVGVPSTPEDGDELSGEDRSGVEPEQASESFFEDEDDADH